jgi:RNA polymerase sigma-70 factor (ECF subfamily)
MPVGARQPGGEEDDRVLVRRLRAGDEQAFQEFFEVHFQPVYRFALSLDRRHDVAREIAQITICTALEKLHLFRGEARLLTWMCAICRFEINAHRRRERRAAASEPLTAETCPRQDLWLEALERDDPERRLLRDETARLVHETMAEMHPRQAQALTWKYTDALPVEEIARRLGVSAKAAESLLTRARDAFRARFPAREPRAERGGRRRARS